MTKVVGMSRLTTYIIANNEDIKCSAGGPSSENGKYMGWITLGEGRYYRPLINSEAIFDSAKDAIKAMEDLVKTAKEFVANEGVEE